MANLRPTMLLRNRFFLVALSFVLTASLSIGQSVPTLANTEPSDPIASYDSTGTEPSQEPATNASPRFDASVLEPGQTVGLVPGNVGGYDRDSVTVTFCLESDSAACEEIASNADNFVVPSRPGFISVSETWKKLGAEDIRLASNPLAIAGSVPVASSAPTVSGIHRVGSILTASAGTWTGVPTPALSYQWLSCDTASAIRLETLDAVPLFSGCRLIAGANGSSYTLSAADTRRWVTVAVRGANSWGAPVAVASFGVQTQAAGLPYVTAPFQLVGQAAVGSTLSLQVGRWDSPTPVTASVQWYSCPHAWVSLSCVQIPKATFWTFSPTLKNVSPGRYLMATVDLRNARGTVQVVARQANPQPVVSPVPASVSKPTVAYDPGSDSMTASPGVWTGNPAPAFTYTWYSCLGFVVAPLMSHCKTIGSGPTLTGVAGKIPTTHTYTVIVRGSNIFGSAEGKHSSIPYRKPAMSSVSTAPIVRVGDTLTANVEYVAFPEAALTYDWFVCPVFGVPASAVASECEHLTDVSGKQFAPSADHVGKHARVSVTVTNSVGTASLVSSRATTILPKMSPPVLSGSYEFSSATSELDKTLGLRVGTAQWSGEPLPTLTFQWFRCSNPVAQLPAPGCERASMLEGKMIPNPTMNHHLNADDFGKFMAVLVTATNPAGSVRVTVSQSTPVTGARAPRLVTAPSLKGSPSVGKTLSVSTGAWSGLPTPAVSVQWYRCGGATGISGALPTVPASCSPIVGQTSLTYRVTSADKWRFITPFVKAQNTTGEIGVLLPQRVASK